MNNIAVPFSHSCSLWYYK